MIIHAIVRLARPLGSRTLGPWRERVRRRRELLGLSDAMLEDVGIEPGDAWREACRPFWLA